jgi:hypothetical protein
MRKIILEVMLGVSALLIAALLILLFTQNIGQNEFDTFSGHVYKAPINISSPVYGQILSLQIAEGDSVVKGQTLATLQILNTAVPIPTGSPLFHQHGKILSLQSPTDGIVGQVMYAPLSTIAGAGTLLQLYATSSAEIQILVPQGKDLSSYVSFAAAANNGQRFPLRVIGQVPTDVISNLNPNMTVYRAACQGCQALEKNIAVTIYAQRRQKQSPLPSLSWLWQKLLNTL